MNRAWVGAGVYRYVYLIHFAKAAETNTTFSINYMPIKRKGIGSFVGM